MSGIFDQILDRYAEKGLDEGREFLYNSLEKITRKSVLRKSLPSYMKEEDFLSETFLVMDEIIRSNIPRKDKITKLFACSRFTNVPQKSKLGLSNRIVYNLDTYDNDGDVCEKSLIQDAPSVNSLTVALEYAGLISEEEAKIVSYLEQGYNFRQIAKELQVSPSYGWTLCNEIREKIKSFKESGLLEDDYHS